MKEGGIDVRERYARPWWLPAALGAAVLFALIGCEQQTPAERVAELRSNYVAEINPEGFVVRELPLVEPESSVEEMPEGEGEAGSDGEPSAAGEEAEEVPTRKDVVLDILIRNEGRENLPGLTVDISMVDAAGNEKRHWRAWIDTSQIFRGPGTQVSYTLEDVPYEPGDGFHAEVRSPVPPAERSEYREFQNP